VENEQKRHLGNLLLMYNLTGIVYFPTRISHSSATAIDNFIIDISCFEDYSVIPLANDLSDHDAQILTIKTSVQNQSDRLKTIRKVDKHTINEFIYALSNESWDNVFNKNDVNFVFNSFLNTFKKNFHSSFPLIRTKSRNYKFNWITVGIKTSCKRKRELFILLRNSNNLALKQYYKKYCKILGKIIKEAKRMTVSKRISKSNNKPKTTWNLINDLLGKQHSTQDILKLTIDGNHVTKQHSIANALNKYFLTIIDKTKFHSLGNTKPDNLTPYSYLDQCSTDPLPPMVFKSFSTQEILSIIKSLNTKNSSSYDEISTKVLKISAKYMLSINLHLQ